jgi:mevalonate kinase
MQFGCSGKIFIVGEYACIEGGPSLLGTIGPDFSLTVARDGEQSHPFAKQSPAGLYLDSVAEVWREFKFEWRDPYDTPIGVGSSSAQFLLSVAAVAKLRREALPSASEVLKLYWKTVGTSQGIRPSGADVVAQWLGGPVVVQNEPFMTRKLQPWKNDDAEFVLAFTGQKAKTHEHLKELRSRGFPEAFRDTLARLNEITLGAVEAWEIENSVLLGKSLTSFQNALDVGGLASPDFSAQLESLAKVPGVLGCKGTGAQGGDCVLFLVERTRRDSIFEALRAQGWSPFQAQWSNQPLSMN